MNTTKPGYTSIAVSLIVLVLLVMSAIEQGGWVLRKIKVTQSGAGAAK